MKRTRSSERQPTITFEKWKYSHYFELIENKGRNVSVRCTLCPGQKLLKSTAVNTTANFTKHLNSQHANVRLVAQDPRASEVLFIVS